MTPPFLERLAAVPVVAILRAGDAGRFLEVGWVLYEAGVRAIEVTLTSVRITGLAMSVGAVWWAARAAGLIASVLAS